MTVVETGTIWAGFDGLGLFGGGNLAGRSFVLSISVDPAAYQYQVRSCSGGNSHVNCALGQNSSPYVVTATVNGVARTWITDPRAPNGGESYLANFLGGGVPGYWDEIYQYGHGMDGSGTSVIAENAIYSYINALGLGSLNFAQDFSYSPKADDYQYAYFNVSDSSKSTGFEVRGGKFARDSGYGGGAVNSLKVSPLTGPDPGPAALDALANGSARQGTPGLVPEPQSFALVMLGLLGMSVVGRRRLSGARGITA